MLSVAKVYKTQIEIEGTLIAIRVARMTQGEATAFRRALDRINSPTSVRLVSNRKEGEEMAKRPFPRERTAEEIAAAEALAKFDADEAENTAIGVKLPGLTEEARAALTACRALVPAEPTGEAFVIPFDEIRLRRLAEMTPAERTLFDELDQAEDAERDEFLREAITKYVTAVEPGQIEETDPDTGMTSPIATGADLVRVFAANTELLVNLVTLIRVENTLSERSKKLWRSQFDFSASSNAPATDPVGSAPAPVVAPAEPKAFARAEDAMAASVTG